MWAITSTRTLLPRHRRLRTNEVMDPTILWGLRARAGPMSFESGEVQHQIIRGYLSNYKMVPQAYGSSIFQGACP